MLDYQHGHGCTSQWSVLACIINWCQKKEDELNFVTMYFFL